MDPQEPTGRTDVWPPPHSSPPRPPPREYGSPGTDEDHRWLWAVVGGLLAIAVFAGGGIWLLSGPDDDEPTVVSDTSSPTPASPSAAASETPSPAASTSEPPAEGARCWDGSTAAAVPECPMPDGADGLAWLFPQLTGQKCRPPRADGPGVVVRVLCSATLADGTTVQLGYYQWSSVLAGDAYYDAQGLGRSDGNGFHGWTATLGNRTKTAVLYADAPFSRTIVYRTAAAGSPELQHLEPRPPDRVRGEPVG